MALKDSVVELVLRAKNLISPETDAAASSVDKFAGSAEDLQRQLRELEDQKGLITQFDRASKAVDRTGAAYDKAQLKLNKLADKIGQSGVVTERQAQEFAIAQKAVEQTERAYRDAEGTLDKLADEAQEAGVDLADLSGAQRENAKQTTATKRALEDYNEELDAGDSRLKRLGGSLAKGIAQFTAWGSAAAAAGAALAFRSLTNYTRESAALADQLTNTSNQLGINTTKLQEYSAATRTVGVDQAQLTQIFQDMRKKVGEAVNGTGELAPVLKQIGVEVKDLIGLSPDEQLEKIAVAISGLGNEEQVNVLERLGSGASKLLPLLQNNASEMNRIVAAAQARGAIIDEDEVQRLVKTQDALNRITERLEGVRNKLVAAVGPAFDDIAKIIDEAFDSEFAAEFTVAIQGVSKQIVAFVRDAVQNFGELKGSIQTVVDTAQFLGNGIAALFRGVQTLAGGFTTSLFGAGTALSKLVEIAVKGANFVGLASDEAVQRAENRTRALAATTAAVAEETRGYAAQVVQAGKDAVSAFDNTESAAASAAGSIAGATGEAEELAGALNGVALSAKAAGTETQSLAQKQLALRSELTSLVPQIRAAQDEFARDSTSENQVRLQRLIKAYDEVVAKIKELDELSGASSKGLRTSTDILTKGLDAAGDSADKVTEKTGRTHSQFVTLGKEIKNVGDTAQKTGEQAEESAGRVGASLSGIISGWLSHISALSQRAAIAFREALGDRGAGQAATELESRLAAVNNRITEMDNRLRSGGAVGKVLRDWAQAGFEVEKSFLEQAIAVEDLTRRIEEGDRSLNVLGKSTEQIEQQFNLLDRAQLSGLLSSVQSVRREIDGLNQSLQDTIASAQQELAALRGDSAEVERLRFQERQLELQEQLDRARGLGDKEAIASAQEALRLTEEAYQLRKRQAEQQDEDNRRAAAERAAQQEFDRQREEAEERQDISRTESRTQAQANQITTRTVRIDFAAPDGRSLGSLSALDDGNVDQFLDALERSGYLATAG